MLGGTGSARNWPPPVANQAALVASKGESCMNTGKVLQMMPEGAQGELKPGDVVSMIPVDVLPFGMDYREQIEAANVAGSTGTTSTVSVTWGPDSDTDPPDSDN
jgi:hypothetical protein